MISPSDVSRLERVLWSMMRSFERLALAQYEAHAPMLATADKRAFVAALEAAAPNDEELAGTPLAAPIKALLVAATGKDEASTLIVQGLVLEQLGRVIYERAHEAKGVSKESLALAARGKVAAAAISEHAASLVEARIGRGEPLFLAFVKATDPVFSRIDPLGEAVDTVFAEPFDIRFADIMGDVTAEVLPTMTGLGVERRKLIVHLTAALMKSA